MIPARPIVAKAVEHLKFQPKTIGDVQMGTSTRHYVYVHVCVCVCVPAALVPDIFRLLSVARGRHWPASQPDILWLVGTCWTFLAKQIFSKDFIFDYALGKMGRRCQKRTEVPSFKMRHLEQIVPLDFSGLLLQPNGRYVLIAKTSNPNMNKVIQLLLLFFDLSVMDGRHMASTQTLISSSDVIL